MERTFVPLRLKLSGRSVQMNRSEVLDSRNTFAVSARIYELKHRVEKLP